MNLEQKIKNLQSRLDQLIHRQATTERDIHQLKKELAALTRQMASGEEVPTPPPLPDPIPSNEPLLDDLPEITIDLEDIPDPTPPPRPQPQPKASRGNLEQFIGGNLINKIGIVILIIGLGLFTKYAIDRGYMPPMLRLALSFAAGLTLVGLGYRLKARYKTYSAVLFSGGMVTLYLSAFAGYAFFDPILLPRMTSFILMVIFTLVTVSAAAYYNQQIVGLLGLVGAYAVPFLLSNNSGNYPLLFAYVAVINTGILLLALRKGWRAMTILGLMFSWLILGYWLTDAYQAPGDNQLGWTISILFFLLFLAGLLGHPLRERQPVPAGIGGPVFFNSLIFLAAGIFMLQESELTHFQGAFCTSVAVIHLLFGGITYRFFNAQIGTQILVGIAFLLLALAIPIQFEVEVFPVLWLGEAALLFWLGRRYKVQAYELMTFALIILGGGALLTSWFEHYYNGRIELQPIFNPHFAVSLVCALAIWGMYWVNQRWESSLQFLFKYLLFLSGIGLIYFAFFNEIYHQYDQAHLNNEPGSAFDYRSWGILWLFNYTCLFLGGLALISERWMRSVNFQFGVICISVITIFLFYTSGMFLLNDYRAAYLDPVSAIPEQSNGWLIGFRYICYGALAFLFYMLTRLVRINPYLKQVRSYFPLVIHFAVLHFLSNELTTLMTFGLGLDTESLVHRVGYSILWGMYALFLIILGFRKPSRPLRIAAIVLFAVTLLKVFLVDLVDISTISKTILFIALGILLLLISFLYQRYREKV